MRSVVVLPAPFGPRKPVTEPGSTVKLSWSTARTLPRNTLVRLVDDDPAGTVPSDSCVGHAPIPAQMT